MSTQPQEITSATIHTIQQDVEMAGGQTLKVTRWPPPQPIQTMITLGEHHSNCIAEIMDRLARLEAEVEMWKSVNRTLEGINSELQMISEGNLCSYESDYCFEHNQLTAPTRPTTQWTWQSLDPVSDSAPADDPNSAYERAKKVVR